MKLEDVLTTKTFLIVGAILILIAALSFTDLSGLRQASIVPQAITIQNINGVDYAIVSMDGLNYGDTDIGFVQDTATQHYDVDGETDSNDNAIEGDFDAVVKLKVLNTGWSMQLKEYHTSPFINKVWVEECGWFNEKTCTEIETGEAIPYYQVISDIQPLAQYEVWAIINGVEQDHLIVDPTNTEQKIQIPGTDPAIYWRETSYGFDGQTKFPTGVSGVDILRKDSSGNIVFAEEDETTVAVSYWNAVLLEENIEVQTKLENKVWIGTTDGVEHATLYDMYVEDNLAQRLDFNNDEVYDTKVGASAKDFSTSDLIHNEYKFLTCDGWGCSGQKGYWLDMPSLHREPYSSDKSVEGYSISGDNEFLMRDGRITISGSFQIPLEYGDVRIVTREAIPKIVSTAESIEVYDGGSKTITVSVKNNGETGKVIVIPALKEGSVGSVVLPDSQSKIIIAGDTVDFEFKLDSNNIGSGDIIFYANAGETQDSISMEFEVISPPVDADRFNVRIVAINPQGTELESLYPGKFSITVDQNDVTEYGIWDGQLWEGTPTVSGQTIVIGETTWHPEDPKKITVEEEDQTFTFIYSTEKDEGDDIGIIWYILSAVVIAGLVLGAYMYINKTR